MSDERWEAIRRQMNVDEAEVLAIRRLMQAEAVLADANVDADADADANADADPARARTRTRTPARTRAGSPSLTDCLELTQRDPDQRADLYLATLARYAAAHGGRIEVRAVLPDGAFTLLSIGDRRPHEPG